MYLLMDTVVVASLTHVVIQGQCGLGFQMVSCLMDFGVGFGQYLAQLFTNYQSNINSKRL
jgi:hypothetical protein